MSGSYNYIGMQSTLTEEKIYEAISDVVDPEIGVPIMEMELIDKLDIRDDGSVEVQYHATTPYCPPVFAMEISQQIKGKIKALQGVKMVKVLVTGHSMSDFINNEVNKD